MIKRILYSALAMLALTAGSASAAVIWSEGFNSGWSPDVFSTTVAPFFTDYDVSNGAVAAPADEGDGHAYLNDSSADISGVSTFSYAEVTLGTVVAAGDTYTFTGNFTVAGWLGGTDYAMDESNSGFISAAGLTPATQVLDLGPVKGTWTQYTFSYTTVPGDVGNVLKFRIGLEHFNTIGGLCQVVTDDWQVDGPALGAIQMANLIVNVRADGLMYYHNPHNGENGYVSNDGVVDDGMGSAAGSAIAMCAFEDEIYTLGQVQTGPNAGQYRVNMIDFSGVYSSVSGDNILFAPPNRNIITNTAAATLVDVVYDGADFWFLADDGKVFTNGSATAAFDFGAASAGVYQSLSLQEGGLVAAGMNTAWESQVLGYNAGGISSIVVYGGSAWPDASNHVARVAGSPDSLQLNVMRADNFGYLEPGAAWWDNFGYQTPPTRGLAQGTDGTDNSAFVLKSDGVLLFDSPAGILGTMLSGNQAVDIAAVDVEYAVQPFPEIPDYVGPNLIPNGDFTSSSSVTPATSPNNTWNILGSFGDWEGATNCTAVADNWSHYYSDPSGLVPAVGNEHVIDGLGELDSTYYLDTHYSALNHITLNSSMNYLNGMKQEDILNAVSIDAGKDYLLSFDVMAQSYGDTASATFTAALTSGSDATNTANAIPGTLISTPVATLPSAGGSPFTAIISGADLIAAGQVNAIFNEVNPTTIPGFPGSVAPGDVSNIALVTQVSVFEVSLAETLVAEYGDLNKDGSVDEADLDLANDTLDGSIDGGDDAVTRQAALIADGMTGAEALEYLNLTEFDLDFDDDFDADDIVVLEGLLTPVLQIAANGGTLDFEWNSRVSKLYDLMASPALLPASWVPYNDGVTIYNNIPGDASGINTLTGVLDSGSEHFFHLVQKDSSTSSIEVEDGSFEDPTGIAGDWAFCHAGWNPTPSSQYALLHNFPNIHLSTADDLAWAALMRAGNIAEISQDLATTVNSGDTLTVSFSVASALTGGEPGNTAGSGTLDATLMVGAVPYTLTVNTAALAVDTWTSYTNTVTISDTGNLSLEFTITSGVMWLDNISDVKREE